MSVGPVRTVRADPIGLVRREVVWTESAELVVHPRTIGVPSTSTGLIRDLEGTPTRDLTSSDVAFHALREYQPGDERRYIHWKSTAKTGTFMVRQFEQTRRSHLVVALTLATGDYASEEEFELAVSVAGSLGVRAIRDGRTVSVVVSTVTPEFAKRKILAVRALATHVPARLLDELAVVDVAAAALNIRDVARVAADDVDGISVAFLVTRIAHDRRRAACRVATRSRSGSRSSRSSATRMPCPASGASPASACSPSATSTTCASRSPGRRRSHEHGQRRRAPPHRRASSSSTRSCSGRPPRSRPSRCGRSTRTRASSCWSPSRPCSASVVAILGAVFRWKSFVVILVGFGVLLLAGVPLAVPDQAIAGFLPSLDGIRELLAGVALGWKQLLTIALPVGDYQALLVPAFVLVLTSTIVALSIALRARWGELGVIPPIVALHRGHRVRAGEGAVAGPVGARHARRRAALADLAALAQAPGVDPRCSTRATDGATSAAAVDSGFGVRNLIAGGLLLAVAATASIGAASRSAAGGDRDVLRTVDRAAVRSA